MNGTLIETQEPVNAEQQHADASGANDSERVQLPTLALVALALLAVNFAVFAWFYFLSPSLKPGTAGSSAPQLHDSVRYAKPSPFTPVIVEQKRKVRAAMKLRPVLYRPEPEQYADYQPTATSTNSYVHGDQVYGVMEQEMRLQRASAVAAHTERWRRTEPAKIVQ